MWEAPIAEAVAEQNEGVVDVTLTPTDHEYEISSLFGPDIFVRTVTLKMKKGGVTRRRVFAYPQLAKNRITGEELPLIAFSNPSPIFGSRALKCNKELHLAEQP